MKRGSAHVRGLYTVPNGSGTQLADGCDVIWNLGLRVVKLYATPDYAADYPLQSAWSSTPTTLATLAATTQYATQLARAWHTVVFTAFTFANGSTNWWRANPSSAKMAAEYTEVRAFAEYLLATYNGSGRRFVLQNWEGDWAFMDAFVADTYVAEKMVGQYAAFLGTRQRAIADARAAVASDCQVLHAVEVNRVVDARLYPHRRRILRDLATRLTPDVVSFSAYDATIVDQGGWGASHAAWVAATTPVYRKALRAIRAAFPRSLLQVGEFGFPENEAPGTADVGAMLEVCDAIAEEEGAALNLFWQVFDNEAGAGPPTYRGYWLAQPNGAATEASAVFEALGPGT